MNDIERAVRNSPLKRYEIANILGVKPQSLWRYMKGLSKPRPEKAKLISRVLGIPFERVYAMEESNPPTVVGVRGQPRPVKSSKPS